MIDKITRVRLRDIWRHEATDFTVWLCDNIDVLNDAIGLELTNPEREQSTGNFYVDIKAEDLAGNRVVIENQLGKSDHDHLGKIITYLAAFEAQIAIWIVAEPKEEHIHAITWLNEGNNNCDFYLLKIEAIRIGDSKPAPLITKIVGPTEESKQVGKTKQEDTERHKLRFNFWTRLLEYAKTKHSLFNSISPVKDSFISVTSGKKGLSYNYWVTQTGIRIELRIDRGKESERENLRIFHLLMERKEEIERTFGGHLSWDESEGYRMCAIRKQLETGGYASPESEWKEIIETAVDTMIRLENATKEIVRKLAM